MLKDLTGQKKIDPQVVLDAIKSLKSKGWDINPYTVADEARIPRSTLYRSQELMDLISEARAGGPSGAASEEMVKRIAELEQSHQQLQESNQQLQEALEESRQLSRKLERELSAATREREELESQLTQIMVESRALQEQVLELSSRSVGPAAEPRYREAGYEAGAAHEQPRLPEEPASLLAEPVSLLDEPAAVPAQPVSGREEPVSGQEEPVMRAEEPAWLAEEADYGIAGDGIEPAPVPGREEQLAPSAACESMAAAAAPEPPLPEQSCWQGPPEPDDGWHSGPAAAVSEEGWHTGPSAPVPGEGWSAPPPPESEGQEPVFPGGYDAPLDQREPAGPGAWQSASAEPAVPEADVLEPVDLPVDLLVGGREEFASPEPGEDLTGTRTSAEALLEAAAEQAGASAGPVEEAGAKIKSTTLSEDELRDLLKHRFGRAPEEPQAGKEEESMRRTTTRFVGGNRAPQEPPPQGFVIRSVPPDIRKACLVLGLRPEELTFETVHQAWKKEMTTEHPDSGGDTEIAVYLNTAKDTLYRFLEAQAPKLGKKFGTATTSFRRMPDRPEGEKTQENDG